MAHPRAEIWQILNDTPSEIANETGFVPHASVPDYTYMLSWEGYPIA